MDFQTKFAWHLWGIVWVISEELGSDSRLGWND